MMVVMMAVGWWYNHLLIMLHEHLGVDVVVVGMITTVTIASTMRSTTIHEYQIPRGNGL